MRAHTFSPWFLHEQESGGEEYAETVPSPRRRTRRHGLELATTETEMLNQLLQGELPTLLIQAQNSPTLARMKKLLLVMLGLWITYFLLVNWFVHSLNKIAVPVLEIPLGTYLAVQGAAIVFGVALFRFTRSAS
jgi:putative solute:sodium symporter small subunit